jgi:hypothetical protein
MSAVSAAGEPEPEFVPRIPTCPCFYKYSTTEHFDWLRHILLNHEIYFATHSELNDPEDGWAALKLLSVEDVISFLVNDFIRRHAREDLAWLAHEVAVIHFNTRHYGADKMLELMEEALKRETERNRIYSLSMACESPSMWKKYGGDHTGYCLEFENDGLFSYARTVQYDAERVRLHLSNPRNFFLFRKTVKWEDEQEARIVLLPRAGPEFFEIFKNGESPFQSFDPMLLRRVILGKNMSASNRVQICAWATVRTPPVLVVDSGAFTAP